MRYGLVAWVAIAWAAGWAATPNVRAAQLSTDELRLRVARLEAEVTAGEDVRAIKRLQRTYGYYLDKGMWTDLAEYFTDDAVANYPAGVFIGKPSIREHLYRNVGAVEMGQVGLGDNRLYNHMNIQPVVHLDPGGQTAKGRWRAFAYFGSFGGAGTWAEGVYEMQYAKQDGVWKIAKLDYHSGFGASYTTGWAAPPAPAATPPVAAGAAPAAPITVPARPRRQLAHPPDRERHMECEGFPAACIAPFHYANPGTPAGGHAWITPSDVKPVSGDPRKELALLVQRATLLQDEQQIEDLQRIYGYYLDRAQWDQVADLFANDGTIELAQQGVYVGKVRVRQFLGLLGPHGLVPGWLNDHIQLQIVVTVAADGKTARARSREFNMTGTYGKNGQWSEGTYENAYVKDGGVWKFQSVHFYPTFITDYDKGWAKDAQPAATASTTLPPDRPPTQVYEIFPKANVPPYHYRNPVSGAAPTYPKTGGPGAQLAAASLMPIARPKPARLTDVAGDLARAEQRIARVKDFHELENLESAYGYYLDKNLWNNLADLFAKNGSIELAQRGVYKGDRVRGFLLAVFGRGQEGPVVGRLGNHVQMQPVIHVAADGQSAKIRLRMLQQLSFGPRASMGGSVYENEAIKEDGVWKFSVVHTYNTFTASYEGGWARGASRGMPGPSPEFPPDSPPTMAIAMFPIVYDIPYHYANPVTGRTELPEIPTLAAQLAANPLPPPAPAPAGTRTNGIPADIAAALREIGPKIEVQRTTALYAPLQPKEPYQGITLVRELGYGPHERQRADVFTSAGDNPRKAPKRGKPVVVFIYGGGYAGGSKKSPTSPFYDNVGVWAVNHGMVGVTINYRLAPEFKYPSGVQDLTLLVQWLKKNVGQYGGDPGQIYFWGHSSGAGHTADYIVGTKQPGIAGAILTSGIYSLSDKVSIWKSYYGEDAEKYRGRDSVAGLVATKLPLLVTYAELDSPNFVADAENLIEAREQAGKPVQHVRLEGHSHLSETYAVGTSDESLSGPVLTFIRDTGAKR